MKLSLSSHHPIIPYIIPSIIPFTLSLPTHHPQK